MSSTCADLHPSAGLPLKTGIGVTRVWIAEVLGEGFCVAVLGEKPQLCLLFLDSNNKDDEDDHQKGTCQKCGTPLLGRDSYQLVPLNHHS